MSKTLFALLTLLIGLLQAWDSSALDAEAWVQGLILVGVMLPAAAILASRDIRVRGGAVALAGALLITARLASSVAMPSLALAAFFPAAVILLDHLRDSGRAARQREEVMR